MKKPAKSSVAAKKPVKKAAPQKPVKAAVKKPAPKPVAKKAPVKKSAPKKPVAVKKAPAKKGLKRSKTKAPATPLTTEEEIRIRAYFISERRHRLALPGDATSDWEEARRQLLIEAGPR